VDYTVFLRSVAQGQVPAVTLMHGIDAQLLDDAVAAVTTALFQDASERVLGREVIDGREADADLVARSAMTMPFMTAARLVVVRRVHSLPPKGASTLAAYARDPNPATRLHNPTNGGRGHCACMPARRSMAGTGFTRSRVSSI